MMRSLCVGLGVALGFTSIGLAIPPQSEAEVPSDKAVLRAAGLPWNFQDDTIIVKDRVGRSLWKCTIYYSTLEPVRLPWVGWAQVAKKRVQVVFLELPGPKA